MDRQKSMKTGNLFQLARRSNFPAPLFLTGVCYWGSSAQKPSPANSPGPFSPTLDSLFLPLPLSSRGVDSQSTLGYHHGYSNRGAFQFPIASEHEPFLSAFESRARSVELTAASTRLVGGQLGGHWSSRRWNVAVCSVLWTFFFFSLSLSIRMDGSSTTTVTTTCASCCLRFKANRWWLEGARGRVWWCRWCGWCCIRDGCPLVGVHLLVFLVRFALLFRDFQSFRVDIRKCFYLEFRRFFNFYFFFIRSVSYIF